MIEGAINISQDTDNGKSSKLHHGGTVSCQIAKGWAGQIIILKPYQILVCLKPLLLIELRLKCVGANITIPPPPPPPITHTQKGPVFLSVHRGFCLLKCCVRIFCEKATFTKTSLANGS